MGSHPRKIFLFGDNFLRSGRGGQAIIRDLSNAQGIATKHSPSMDRSAFFYDRKQSEFILPLLDDLRAVEALAEANDIVVPTTGEGVISLGLGLARLNETAPATYRLICSFLDALADRHGGWRDL